MVAILEYIRVFSLWKLILFPSQKKGLAFGSKYKFRSVNTLIFSFYTHRLATYTLQHLKRN